MPDATATRKRDETQVNWRWPDCRTAKKLHALARKPGNMWAVDSFFDITYRIDFVGHPGVPFTGMSGSTLVPSQHFQTGGVIPEPAALVLLPVVFGMLHRVRLRSAA
ncbi:MAG: hypothetical protein ACREJC_16085 [Tepidisphaeraceae bacterium]